MPPEPVVKRAVAFIDGQNLFHAAREAFGYPLPQLPKGRREMDPMKMDPMKVATIGLLAELPELLGTEEEAKRGAKVALVLDLVRLEFRGHHTKG